MSDRQEARARFLSAEGYGGITPVAVSGDASNRAYFRLTRDGRTVILMDAPPEKGEDVRPFVRIARHLAGIGLAAPEIFAADEAAGFLLIEDLGDDLYARVLARLSGAELVAAEKRLYSGAIDVLARLHAADLPPGIETYGPEEMADRAALAFDWYLAGTRGADDPARGAFHRAIHEALAALDTPPVLILRDYHAENLLWMPEREGLARVGLLDFQDATAGHPAYDLVSLLQDARRDVSPEIETQTIARFCAATGTDEAPFTHAYHLLGLQRNLRILGVFARLCLRDGKAHYPDFMPRVWGLILRDLSHPALAPFVPLVTGTLPEPTPDLIRGLKDRCGQPLTA